MNAPWSNRHIGIPFAELGRQREGADCWGLACIVYREELGISLPDYLGYASVAERDEIASLVAGAVASPLWVPQTGPAIAFDIALFRRGRLDGHVGIVVQHGLMLHMVDRERSALETFRKGHWKHRLTGIYRHVEIISRGARA